MPPRGEWAGRNNQSGSGLSLKKKEKQGPAPEHVASSKNHLLVIPAFFFWCQITRKGHYSAALQEYRAKSEGLVSISYN